jgi:hypothetical protein
MARKGRPRLHEGVPEYLEAKLPKKESEEHRQMRAFWLALPEKERTYGAVATAFKCSIEKVSLASRAFAWLEDAQARDASIDDPFYELHQKEVEEVRLKAFHFLCTALDQELARQALTLSDSEIIEKIKQKDLDGALSGWTAKDWQGFVKALSLKAKDYKDFTTLIEGIQRIVFEWNPNQVAKRVPGKAQNMEFNQVNLIIEK